MFQNHYVLQVMPCDTKNIILMSPHFITETVADDTMPQTSSTVSFTLCLLVDCSKAKRDIAVENYHGAN